MLWYKKDIISFSHLPDSSPCVVVMLSLEHLVSVIRKKNVTQLHSLRKISSFGSDSPWKTLLRTGWIPTDKHNSSKETYELWLHVSCECKDPASRETAKGQNGWDVFATKKCNA